MKNKGFTLVELMVVIVIIVIVSTIGFGGVALVQQKTKEALWDSKVDIIESAAVVYGEDNLNRLVNTCTVAGVTKTSCLTTTVGDLIELNYIRTDERDEDDNPVIINESLPENDANYYANNLEVFIYLEENSGVVYAKLNYEENSENTES